MIPKLEFGGWGVGFPSKDLAPRAKHATRFSDSRS